MSAPAPGYSPGRQNQPTIPESAPQRPSGTERPQLLQHSEITEEDPQSESPRQPPEGSSASLAGHNSPAQHEATQRGGARKSKSRPSVLPSTSASSFATALEEPQAARGAASSSNQVPEAPKTIFYDFNCSRGNMPEPRWGHSSCVIGDCLFIFGGVGDKLFNTLHVYSTGKSLLLP